MRTTVAALALLLSAPLVPGPAAAAAVPDAVPDAAPAPAYGSEVGSEDGLLVTGYALPSTRPAIVRRDAPSLDTVTVSAVRLRGDARPVTPPEERARRLVEVAHRQGLRAELLVGNWSNRLGAFDPAVAAELLSYDRKIAAVADEVTALVAAGGWDGVNVDLELIRRRDGRGLVAFVTALRERLPATASLTIDVSAGTTQESYVERGYRLAGLAAVVDAIQLMAYDQHGPGWSGPGPIGGLQWVRRSVDAALEEVPADRLDLGIAAYGYVWRPDGSGRTLTVKAARRLVDRAGGAARWSLRHAESSALLPDGRRVWWSDGWSYDIRAELARQLGLRGTAIWRLGSAGPLS